MEVPVLLFSRPGRKNTDAALKASKRRVEELGLRVVVVASSTGRTALRAAKAFSGYELVAVTLQAGRWKVYAPPEAKLVEKLRAAGVRVLTYTLP